MRSKLSNGTVLFLSRPRISPDSIPCSGHDPFSRPNLSQIKVETNTEGLDWERIAEKVCAVLFLLTGIIINPPKVSTVSSTTRTARECEIRWVGNRHPIINHASWPQTELARLKALISDRFEGPINWVDIAKKLGVCSALLPLPIVFIVLPIQTNRTPIDCMRHAIQRRHHLWDTQSDQRLLEAVKIYGTNNWNLGMFLPTSLLLDLTDCSKSNLQWQDTHPRMQRLNNVPADICELSIQLSNEARGPLRKTPGFGWLWQRTATPG
jgi:hypothetical protein